MSTQKPAAPQGTIRENKLELVERLADDLAHEIKNPLHSMVINLEVLRRRITRIETDAGADLLRYANILGAELERVNRRVDLLLRMVRPSRDGEDLAGVAEVLEELRELMELECQRHGANLEISYPGRISRPDLPRASTRQMLLSLMLETLDRTPPGGTLHLQAESDGAASRIRIFTSGSLDAPLAEPREADDPSFFTVAESLAQRLGARLEALNGSAPDPSSPDSVQVGFCLTLPRPTQPSAAGT